MDAVPRFVMLPVPIEHYDAVVTHLAKLVSSPQMPEGESKPTSGIRTLPPREWTADEIARLKKIRENPFLITTMELLGERGAGTSVSFAEVIDRTGLAHNQVRAFAAGMSKSIGHYFDRSNWPFNVDFSIDGTAHYVCHDQRILDWWKAA